MKNTNIIIRSALGALALAATSAAALADHGSYSRGGYGGYGSCAPRPVVIPWSPPHHSYGGYHSSNSYSRGCYVPPPPAIVYRSSHYSNGYSGYSGRSYYNPPPVYRAPCNSYYSRGYSGYRNSYPSSGLGYSWGGGCGSRSGGSVWFRF